MLSGHTTVDAPPGSADVWRVPPVGMLMARTACRSGLSGDDHEGNAGCRVGEHGPGVTVSRSHPAEIHQDRRYQGSHYWELRHWDWHHRDWHHQGSHHQGSHHQGWRRRV